VPREKAQQVANQRKKHPPPPSTRATKSNTFAAFQNESWFTVPSLGYAKHAPEFTASQFKVWLLREGSRKAVSPTSNHGTSLFTAISDTEGPVSLLKSHPSWNKLANHAMVERVAGISV
jgi:hypothetical protein